MPPSSWLPNPENEDNYAHLNKILQSTIRSEEENGLLAWSYLRRNPLYQNEYYDINGLPSYNYVCANPKEKGLPYRARLKPAAKKDETYAEYCKRFTENGILTVEHPQDEFIHKFKLKKFSDELDPKSERAPKFISSPYPLIEYHNDIKPRTGPPFHLFDTNLEFPDEILVRFSALWRCEDQLEVVKKELTRIEDLLNTSDKINGVKGCFKTNYIRNLRLLDAQAYGWDQLKMLQIVMENNAYKSLLEYNKRNGKYNYKQYRNEIKHIKDGLATAIRVRGGDYICLLGFPYRETTT